MKSKVSLYPETLVQLDNIEAVPVAFRTGYAATSDATLSTCSATVANGNPHNGVFSYARYTAVSTNGVAAERNGFDAYGRRVWNVKTAKEAIMKTEAFFHSVKMPTRFCDYKISAKEAARKVRERFAERDSVFGEHGDITPDAAAKILLSRA